MSILKVYAFYLLEKEQIAKPFAYAKLYNIIEGFAKPSFALIQPYTKF